MAPTQVREPFHREGWIYEEKVDGWRILAYKDRDRVRLVSRSGRDHTRRFAGIAAAIAKLAARALVLDGEAAIYDGKLRSRFDWLREPDADAVGTSPVLMAFDLLYQDGREFTGRPLRERRARLENVVVFPVRRLARNGFEAWSELVAHDYEGLVAKDEASLYEAGPTRRWLVVEGEVGGLDRRRGSLVIGARLTRPYGTSQMSVATETGHGRSSHPCPVVIARLRRPRRTTSRAPRRSSRHAHRASR